MQTYLQYLNEGDSKNPSQVDNNLYLGQHENHQSWSPNFQTDHIETNILAQ